MRYRWGLDPASEASGTPERGMEPLVARVLASRGMQPDEARAFLNVRMQDLESPSLTPGVDRAAQAILDAAAACRSIVIYGDYDVDGTTSIAILVRTLRTLHPQASIGWYVPHRIEEGYGLHGEALRELKANGTEMVVSVDCGISATHEARLARELGLELIITDHHNPSIDGTLPEADVIVHPRIAHQDGSPPKCSAEPAGAGVAFKLAWKMCIQQAGSERVGQALQRHLLDMMALAALGTIADVVPLVGENRILARYGLQMIRSCGIVGVRALLEASGLSDGSISEEKVGFVIAPRINACGRMGHAREAVELLLTEDESLALSIAGSMSTMNDDRRATEQRILREAIAMAEDEGCDDPSVRALVLAHHDWHPGVIGIVCSRLVDMWHKPSILLQKGESECAGSGRSIDGFSLSDALATCGSFLLGHGGHDMAAGLRLATSELGAFREAFTSLASERLSPEDMVPTIRVDCECSLHELSLTAANQLGSFAPFGRLNAKPAVLVRDLRLTRDPMMMGKGNAHLSLQTTASDGGVLRLVGWRWGEHADSFRSGMGLDAVIEPSINEWRGRQTVEGVIRDVRIHSEAQSPVVVTATSSIPS